METNIIRTTEGFLSLKNDWERIEKTAPWVSYFSTFRYNFEWWKAYEDDPSVQLFIMIVIHNGSVVAIAPLQIITKKTHGVAIHSLQFIHGGGDYANFIVDHFTSAEPGKMINDLLAQIEAHKDEYDEVLLTHICQHTLLAHQILISKNNKDFQYLIECPNIDFSNYPDFDAYTKAFIPKKIKQYIHRFEREVDYRMEVTSRNMIEEMGKIHIAEKDYLQTKGFEQRHSFFENPRDLYFRKALYTNNDNVLTYMLVDNKSNDIICYYTGYVKDDVFHSVTTAYNPAFARLAVGKIFNYMIFEENYKNPRWQIFDMGTGRYAWKFEMTDSFNLLYKLHIECIRSNKDKKILSFFNMLSSIKQLIGK